MCLCATPSLAPRLSQPLTRRTLRATGSTQYRRAAGETTEWEDILHRHGIIEKQNPGVRRALYTHAGIVFTMGARLAAPKV